MAHTDDLHHQHDEYGPITLGEVIRLLHAQGKTIELIHRETRDANDKVISHGARLDGIDREIRDLKAARATPGGGGADDKSTMTFSIPMNTKTMLIVLTALATVLLLAAGKLSTTMVTP